jgi:toxin YoeB
MKSIESKYFADDIRRLLRENKNHLTKLERLMREALAHPREGTGRPEPLDGYGDREVWSQRIDGKHRLIYEILPDCIAYLNCHGHYVDH